MGSKTDIEWTRGEDGSKGATWNPVTGCTKVSPGCDNCYAKTMHERFNGPGPFDTVTLHEDRLDKPLRWRKPRKVFVNSMSDLFHQDIPDLFITRVFDVMEQAHWHTFQVLTKRHARMRSFVQQRMERRRVYADSFASCPTEAMRTSPAAQEARQRADNPPANIWLGVSVENQKWADIRIPALLETPAAVRFLSCEPLAGPVDLFGKRDRSGHRPRLTYWLDGRPSWGEPDARGMQPLTTRPSIDWVIVGGESGHGARPMHPDWPRTIRDQCQSAGVPFLFKQWGEWGDLATKNKAGQFEFSGGHAVANDGTLYKPGDLAYPDGPRYGEAVRADHGHAHLTAMYKLGKKVAGRELDGRTWDEYPNSA